MRNPPFLFAVLGLALMAWAPAGRAQIFVPNSGASSVTVYELDADGNAAPIRSISGPSTGLSTCFALSLDPLGDELFVSNLVADSVTVYDLDADGDVPPSRTLSGPATQLSSPIGLDLDPAHGELFVRNFGGDTILVFDADAIGNTAPIRTLSGAATGIANSTTDFFVDSEHDELIVASRVDPGAILFFPRTADGNVAPIREISGAATGLLEPYGIFVDTVNDEILVTTQAQEILVFDRGASGNVAPLRTLTGPTTGLGNPTGVFVDRARDELVVANQTGPSVTVYPRTADGDIAPLRILAGAATELSNPTLLDLLVEAFFVDGFESGNTSRWSSTVP